MKDLKKGDLVLIADGSWAIKVNQDYGYAYIGACKDTFEVVNLVIHAAFWAGYSKEREVHNIIIRNTKTGEVFLHSKSMVELINPKVWVTIDGKEGYINKELAGELKRML
jgi:hypothetical protein